MSLWCVQSGRQRRRRLAGAALCALLAVAFFGCGRTAPEDIWQPTSDDTVKIKAAIEQNKDYFRTGLAELAMQFCDTALPGTTRTILYKELAGNRFKGRFRVNAIQHVLDSPELKYTFIAGLDTLGQETTCTVTMAETVQTGKILMHAWEKTNYIRDSVIIVPPAETLRLPFYTAVMESCDTVIEKPIDGASIEGCVFKKVDGTWQLWKMAGGGRFYSPGPNDAPYIVHFSLRGANSRLDSVFLRPDTTHYGVQRLYSVSDQLLTYSVGDWVLVSVPFTNQGNAYDYLYFNGKRYEVSDTLKFDSVTPGIYRLSLEHIPASVLWEVDAATSPYNATTWGIPIRIQ